MRMHPSTCLIQLFLVTTHLTVQSAENRTVKVLDASLTCISTLSSPEQIAKFETLWNVKEPVSIASKPEWVYKIDLSGFKHGGRWLYSPAGYVQSLKYDATLLYKVPNHQDFNTLIGISK
jgi:hypothetical protein